MLSKQSDLEQFNNHTRRFEMLPTFSGDFFQELVQYPIVVEMWDKVVGRNNTGRKNRAWLASFTEDERRTIHRYYNLFYRWYLRTGTPQYVIMRLKTLHLLQRAVHFFATI